MAYLALCLYAARRKLPQPHSLRSREEHESSAYNIEVLNIKPNEFGPLYDSYYVEKIKHWFMNDAQHQTVDYALQHYQKYKLFDQAWVAEFEKEQGNEPHLTGN
jgi:hypothetical protein